MVNLRFRHVLATGRQSIFADFGAYMHPGIWEHHPTFSIDVSARLQKEVFSGLCRACFMMFGALGIQAPWVD